MKKKNQRFSENNNEKNGNKDDIKNLIIKNENKEDYEEIVIDKIEEK